MFFNTCKSNSFQIFMIFSCKENAQFFFLSAAIALYLGVKREDLVKKVRKDEISDMVP